MIEFENHLAEVGFKLLVKTRYTMSIGKWDINPRGQYTINLMIENFSMATEQEISLKIIADQIGDLMDSGMVSYLETHPNQLATFSLEWTDGIARFRDFRDQFTPEENARILEGFAAVKSIAEKLKLTWYE